MRDDSPSRRFVPPLVAITFGVLVIGLALPVVDTKQLGFYRETYSVVGGILDLGRNGHPGLALLICLFSIVFPIAKLLALGWLWVAESEPGRRDRLLGLLGGLGRWSMLDVFVVVLLIGTLNLGLPSGATARPGIHVFGAAILLSMLVTHVSIRWLGGAELRTPRVGSRSPCTPWFSLAALCFILAGLVLPLMRAKKWVFWDLEYSIARGTWNLFVEGELLLGLAVAGFVILAPLLGLTGRIAAWGFARSGRRNARLERWVHRIARWSMADVFALALFVVVTKLSGLIEITARAGVWWFGAGVLICACLPWLERRVGERASG